MTFRPAPLLFAAFWIFFLVAGQSKLLRDPGTLWHTKVGQKVLTEGFFQGDPFTFTHEGQRWVPHQWLGEVIMAAVHAIGGFDAFILLAATILAALFTWLTLRLLHTGLNFAVVAVVAGCALAATSTHLHVRPLLMTTAGIAILAVLLTDFDAGRIGFARLLWLVPLFMLWTNIHGGMLGGLATLGLVVVGWIVWKLLGWPSPVNDWRTAAMLVGLVVLCGLTMFANPYGSETPRAWLIILRSPKIPELIEEHQPLDPSKPTAWALFLFAAVYLFVLAGTSKPRVTWLLPLFWLVQSFLRVRHAPLFALTAYVAVAAMWPSTRWAAWLAKRRPDVYDPASPYTRTTSLDWLLCTLMVLTSFGLQAANVEVPVVGAGWAELEKKRWPLESLETIKMFEPTPEAPANVFNDCALGGFLIYFTQNYRTFIDDRAELFGEAFLEEFVRGGAIDTPAAMVRWQANFPTIHFALVQPGNNFDKYFKDNGWELLSSCDAANFYKRPAAKRD